MYGNSIELRSMQQHQNNTVVFQKYPPEVINSAVTPYNHLSNPSKKAKNNLCAKCYSESHSSVKKCKSECFTPMHFQQFMSAWKFFFQKYPPEVFNSAITPIKQTYNKMAFLKLSEIIEGG